MRVILNEEELEQKINSFLARKEDEVFGKSHGRASDMYRRFTHNM